MQPSNYNVQRNQVVNWRHRSW